MMVIHNPKTWIETLKPRGPESMTITTLSGDITLGFTRLAINGLSEEGMQPFGHRNNTWMCNGEIYNWKDLAVQHGLQNLTSGSDCEVIGYLYEIYKNNLAGLFRALDGVFALVIVDKERNRMIVARDPYGVRPLYTGTTFLYKHENGSTFSIGTETLFFSSELKGLIPISDHIAHFPPGTYQVIDIATKKILFSERYHTTPWIKNPMFSLAHSSGLEMACASLRFSLEEAVKKRMLTERPVAALLSGGIDSSLIASLVQKQLRWAGAPPLRTFSIGMKGSEDLRHAKMVADWIGSNHTEIVLTADDFFKAIPQVIRAIETYDTTSVRASVGNWLVSKAIKEKSDCKVVFNGDGSDDVFGSYLYFYKAPSDRDFEEETERLLKDIHYFDVLRSDRSISSHGLEPRTPFLDKQFVAVAKQIATCWRRPSEKQCEKWILRRAFDDGQTLPHEVLWRRKEAFSDGVSSTEKSWYQEIQDRCDSLVPDDWVERLVQTPNSDHLTPQTKEQYYYRFLFHTHFGTEHSSIVPYFWMPKWSPGATDPSARTLSIYHSSA
jgi:asparagine synthase (glutamine-hydrolysing)